MVGDYPHISRMTKLEIMAEAQYYSALGMQLVIIVAMSVRRLFLNAKYFYAYIVWQTLAIVIMYALHHLYPRGPQFFYAYWINNAINICLGIAIIMELFNRMFDPYRSIRRFAKLMLLWSGAVLVLVGALLSIYREAEYSVPMLTGFFVAERSLRVIQLGLILVLLALTRYLHLRWKNHLFGIPLGFGFYALMALVGLTVRMHYGKPVAPIENVLQGTAYCAAVLIWFIYVLQRDAAPVSLIPFPSEQLEKWDHILEDILSHRK